MWDIFDKGYKCGNLGPVLIALTLITIALILAVELVTMIANPLAAFVVGVAVDQTIDWLFEQSQDCQPP